MKKVLIIAIAFLAFSCKKQEAVPAEKQAEPTASEAATSEGMAEEIQTPEQLGKQIFEGKGTCVSCHKTDVKLIGPSLQDIAKMYKEKNGNIVTFLKGESKPIVDPAQYALMQPNIVLTKTMTDEELKALEAYVYSNLK
ncbi:c-type cytochrome [Flavobacterium sp. LB3P122]|uniref:c-type cytochrome n=1 Tax=Flavobacterium algoriphilum TaxID=3398738 RepID=UPI003A8BE88A